MAYDKALEEVPPEQSPASAQEIKSCSDKSKFIDGLL